VVSRLLHSDTPVDFEGEYYFLEQAVLLPRPQRPGGPPIVIGGKGRSRTLPLVARFAGEWNGVSTTPQEYRELNDHLDRLLDAEGRDRQSVRRTVMTGCVFARDQASLQQKLELRTGGKYSAADLHQRGYAAGLVEDIAGVVSAYEQAGAQRIMLQWLELDDLDGLAAMAHGLIST